MCGFRPSAMLCSWPPAPPGAEPQSHRRRNPMALIVVRNRVIICLLFLLSAGPFANASFATAQSSANPPVRTPAVATSLPADAITVSGNGFSGGGLVYVALYDQSVSYTHLRAHETDSY